MLNVKPVFSLSSFTLLKRFFSSSSLFCHYSAIICISDVVLLTVLIPACESSSPVFCMMYSIDRLNKWGDNIQPWHTPFPILNQSIVPYLVLTVAACDCGSGHELLTAKFRLKSKKIGKTTSPFRYDLNEIPYDYTVNVMRFQGLDLVGRVPEELWRVFITLYRRW